MSTASDVVICHPLRTPIGAFHGSLATVSAVGLATTVLETLRERAGLGEGDVDEVILGNCNPNAEAPAIGRVAALDAGLGVGVAGVQVDRRCASGLQAVLSAVLQVGAGVSRVVIAGGTESMSQVEHYALGLRRGRKGGSIELVDRLDRARVTAGGRDHPIPGGMIQTAENLRADYGITRIEQDELAAISHERALAAIEQGRFSDEIVPVVVPGRRRGESSIVDRDEHPRAGTTAAGLAALRPVLASRDSEATVTAGNASGQNDGAAACLVTTRDEAERRGWEPFVRVRSWAVCGVDPERMGLGPVPASRVALDRAGLDFGDLDLIELNEAFAAQAIACLREWELPDGLERVNVNGSGISLGHPIGATGARILATLAHELRRREARLALETMCVGGGQGMAAVFERA